MTRSVDSHKWPEWRRRMSRFLRSQRSVVQFCRDEGVSVPSFYQWRKKLQQHSSAAAIKDQTRHAATRSPHADNGFRPVHLVAAASVVVRLPGGTQIDVPTADPAALQLAIQTLAQLDAERCAGGTSC